MCAPVRCGESISQDNTCSSPVAADDQPMTVRSLILMIAFTLCVLLAQSRKLYDTDMFWQLKTGQLIWSQGGLVWNDPFTSTHHGDPVPPIYWLCQLTYAGVFALGSWRLLHQFNVFMFMGAIFLAAYENRGRQASVFSQLFGICLAMLVMLPHCNVRAQTFSLVWLALLMLIVGAAWKPWQKLAAAALLFVVWQNLHPSLPLAIAYLGCRGAGEFLRAVWLREASRWKETALLGAVALVCMVATPMGFSIFELSGYNAQISRELGVSEWMPLWDPEILSLTTTAWLAVAITVALLLYVGRAAELEDLTVCIGMTLLPIIAFRFALFWALAMVPIWIRWMELARPRELFAQSGEDRLSKPVSAALCLGLLLIAIALPRLGSGGLFSQQLPLEGIRRLQEAGKAGVVYNGHAWGGPLIQAGYPNWQVAIDGRLYLYSSEEWKHYQEVAAGRISVAEVVERYQPDIFFLQPDFQREFCTRLREDPGWREFYQDRTCSIFVAADAPPSESSPSIEE